jgi:hypothetical protein
MRMQADGIVAQDLRKAYMPLARRNLLGYYCFLSRKRGGADSAAGGEARTCLQAKPAERRLETGVDKATLNGYCWRLPRNAVVNDQNNAD